MTNAGCRVTNVFCMLDLIPSHSTLGIRHPALTWKNLGP